MNDNKQPEPINALPANAIAIIGIGGRFPGADDMEQFWENIRGSVSSITRFSDAELEDAFSDEVRKDPHYVRARSILKDVDKFDAEFFGMRAREADLTDPQARLLLECAWKALEDGGYDPARYPGAIGIFAGCSMNTYFLNNVSAQRATTEAFTSTYQVGSYDMLMGALSDTLATRVAYKLNLRGPAMTVQSACSTSLLAVSQACQSLLLCQADMVLAGAVSITFPQKRGYLHQEGGMVSPDGVCRPFDARAGGTVFGDGAAIVLLKRLEDAVADGDRVYAIIRGSAINNDGSRKVGFTAPSVNGQADVITAAHAVAEIDPGSIGYVECHGTATPLGDPIEFSGLVQAFGPSADGRATCALGSVKANVGHLDVAAGATGLIKAALALHHREIPPLANFQEPNPRLNLKDSPFYFPSAPMPWPDGATPRRAGVSAFGVGGTNVHVVLEEAPPAQRAGDAGARTWQVLPLSARSETALAEMRAALAKRLAADESISLADAAYTLQLGRGEFNHRFALACRDRDEAVQKLGAANLRETKSIMDIPVVFMFPGQGAQYPGMGRGLYESEPVFREQIDRGAALLKPILGQDIRTVMFGQDLTDEDAAKRLGATQFAQPALFLVEYATARLWMSWGIRPQAMVGHSIGEFVAACLSGVLTMDDALRLVARRGELLQSQPAGAMLAVRLPESDVRDLLGDKLDLASVNAPSLCVVAGPFDAVAELEARLITQNVAHKRLHTSHAFHSRMMEPATEKLAQAAAAIPFHAPEIPYASSTTGGWITREQAASPSYWARHCRETVQFAKALTTACGERPVFLLEVGPGSTLNALAAQCLTKDRAGAMAASLGDASRTVDDNAAMAEALGRLWCAGVCPDWAQLHGPGARRIGLPAYSFQRQRHWIDAPAPARCAPSISAAETSQLPDAPADVAISVSPAEEASMPTSSPDRKNRLRTQIVDILETLSGDPLAEQDSGATFLELGFDSLFLGQVAQQLKAKVGVDITFRQLLGDLATIDDLAAHLDSALPPEAVQVAAKPQTQAAGAAPARPAAPGPATGDIAAVMRMQVEAMQALFDQQLRALGGAPAARAAAPAASKSEAKAAPAEKEAANPRFAAHTPGTPGVVLSEAQQRLVAEIIARATARSPGSKAYAQRYRPVLADPRTAAGFRLEWKDLVFPVVCARSKGSKIWDVDGNAYVDLVNGYGQTAFGHAPDFVCKAVAEQLEKGFAIGPQSDLTGEVAELIAEMTGSERVTFCNTGSEAVMAAMRLSRAATGRKRIVVFNHDYHGQFDEVLVKGGRQGAPRALPIASGIPIDSVTNMVVLPYGTDESLEWIRRNAAELAAVIVEPVQSRHPDFRPVEFLKALRGVTEAAGTVLVFDEVVTGFRVHQAGAQAVFGIRADLATYGKVLGGGMPIGVLAGKAKFMDILDGGQWRYGDESTPEVAPTFFAGTFVRHPLVLAGVRATLRYMKAEGPALQDRLAEKTAKLVAGINADLARRGIATRAETFSSWFHISFGAEHHLGSLFYPLARSLGLHIQEGYPCFLTTQHSEADIAFIASVFKQSLDALQAAGILAAAAPSDAVMAAPVPQSAPQSPAPLEAPLTEPQMEIWLAAQLGDEASASFNESLSIRLEGDLDVQALTGAWDDVVARHDALRSRVSPTGARTIATADLKLPLPVIDLSGTDDAEPGLRDLLALDARTPFNLTAGPLARAQLARLGDKLHMLVFTAHHIVCDGWSVNIVLNELAACYSARTGARSAGLAAPMSFARYAVQQHERGEAKAGIEGYWTKQFPDIPALPDLPTDRPRPGIRSFGGDTCTDFIDVNLYRAIKKAGARQGCTLFASLFAALQVLVARLSGQNDVVLAVPAAGQTLLEDGTILVGHCVNLLPLRVPLDPAASFASHLQQVKRRVLDAYEHQDFTFGTLVRKLAIPRSLSRLPLTEIQFNLERIDEGAAFAGLSVAATPNAKAFSNFDLFFNVVESDRGLRIDCDFNTDVFDRTTVARWIGHYRTLLAAIAEDATKPVDALPLLSRDERRWLATQSNGPTAEYPKQAMLHELISAQARRTPNRVAAADESRQITYAELEELSNRLARRLLRAAPKPGARVAVAMSRSVDMLAALIAVWKAGHAYVPLDPNHPPVRLRQIVDDAEPQAFLCDDAAIAATAPAMSFVIRTDLERAEIALLDSEPLPAMQADSSRGAYVIYTSGSTGKPKGVEVSHRALVNLLCAMADAPGFTADDVMLSVTTISFDIAGLELYLPLIAGGRVVIASRDEVRGGFGLVERLKACGATMLQATPTLWRMIVEAGYRPNPGLKMLCGGEPLPRDLADQLLEGGGALWNMYGPTETTIWSSAGRVAGDGPIHIGSPIANTQLHILDDRGRLVPIGVPGNLFIGGDGLANGYFRKAELTARAFREIALEDSAARRLYRTGDLALRRPNGDIQLLGRADTQVKVRGFRIELEEIEAVLRRADGVADCAVAVRDVHAEPQLVGYIVAQPGAKPAMDGLAAHVAAHLPEYMVPAVWVTLEKLPLTPNRKLDRKSLPGPGADSRLERDVVAPRTRLENSIAGIWRDVLKLEIIGVHDNLFSLGASSLHIFRIAARMIDANLNLQAKHLLHHPTIAQIATLIESAGIDGAPDKASTLPSLRDFRGGARRGKRTS
ncbi:MAG TPA: amino acid adenylation domain-containing protein [Rhizomicrobium sp.]|nr:amino acid adenylation domain-containing protein [Rhizomicrobium sp.]